MIVTLQIPFMPNDKLLIEYDGKKKEIQLVAMRLFENNGKIEFRYYDSLKNSYKAEYLITNHIKTIENEQAEIIQEPFF